MKAAYDYINGPLANPRARAPSIDAKAPYVDLGTGLIDPRLFYSPDVMKLEWEKLWTKVWTLAGLTCDIPNVGDYFKYDLGKESFVVVRTAEATIKAFYNVCPHRGNQLVWDSFGTLESNCFSCKFHNWRFTLDGRLRAVYRPETFRPEVLRDGPRLTEVRCEIWSGMVFICMDESAPPLLEFLGVIPEHLAAYPIERFRVSKDDEICWGANWKTALDAFLEFYHGAIVHPELGPVCETYHIQYDQYPLGISRMLIPMGYVPDLNADTDVVNEGLKSMVREYGGNPEEFTHLKGTEYQQAIVTTKRRWARKNGLDFFDNLTDQQISDVWNYHIFPNVTLNIYPNALLIQRFLPHPDDPNQSIYNPISMNLPVADPDYKMFDITNIGKGHSGETMWTGIPRPPRTYPKTDEELGFVLAQDAYLVPHVQAGIRSRAYKGYRLGEQEIRIRHYLAELERYLSA
jgi:carnitine monooxygenase subunit